MSFFNRHTTTETEPEEQEYFTPRSLVVPIATISGTVNYRIKELLAEDRNLLLFETGKLLGESSGGLVESYLADVNQAVAFGLIAQGLYKNASPRQLADFLKDVIQKAVESPAKVEQDFSNHFCRYYDHQWSLIAAIYEQNFGSTIQELKKKLSALGLLTPLSSSPPSQEPPPVQKPGSDKPSMTINHPNGK